MSWPEEFAVRYQDWSAQMTEDVPFYVDLVRDADGPLVELAVGNGRVAVPVAGETGRRVVGIDSSPALVYCPFRALLHLPTWADRPSPHL